VVGLMIRVTPADQPPSCLAVRQAPVNLDRPLRSARSTHCSVVKEPGSTAHHREGGPPWGLTLYCRSEQATIAGRVTGRGGTVPNHTG
jgi:hypothetical protein